MRPLIATSLGVLGLATGEVAVSHADPTSGIDSALFRSSYDTGGIFAVEGARLMPKRDLSFKVLLGYGKSPLDLAVPGIGAMAGDTTKDRVLDYAITLDMAFGMSITDRIAIGLNVGAYRTATGTGYGARGRYQTGGTIASPSTGLVALRDLSNIDPSANPNDPTAYLGDGLAGPLDARAGIKIALWSTPHLALTAVGSVFLPFGDDEMLLGDRNLVFEPKLALDWRQHQASHLGSTRLVANVAARLRERTVLQSYDGQDAMATDADAKAFLDVGSEIVAGLGAAIELVPRVILAVEGQVFVPLGKVAYGTCRLHDDRPCSALVDSDYFADAKRGDLTSIVTAGLMLRITADVTANVMFGTGLGGARADDFRVTTGLLWSPQPAGAAAPGRRDRDGDGLPDSADGCADEAEDKDAFQDEDGCPELDNDGDGIPDGDDACANEPEDKDGFQDTDGCPERDNDSDAIPDAVDRCADQAEDVDGFEDEDGCPDEDNDGDGIADKTDKCPNDVETVNGVDDDDGCPDQRGTTGPEERADRIDLKGAQVAFGRTTATLAAPARPLLTQVAALIKHKQLTIRVEVHVALGTKSTNAGVIAAQKRKDKLLARQRAKVILDYLIAQGVVANQIQAVGLGSDRPLGTAPPTDASQDRVDLIKAQQGGAP